ncbi:MAG: 2,5-diketo-D-gluconate reductase [Actinomycetota bacterium]|jgi:2,5-diketo-D-gluconate reductase A|nr:2,5-diketo-D-gluconate reductase [Actinomycetota bacterium]
MTSESAVPTESAGLPNGGRMPLLGFGTWQIKGADARRSVSDALEVGYRHLDTAKVYGNESEVGAALQASGVDRGEVFVTTKIPPNDVGRADKTLAESLDKLGLTSLDLWLIHWPGGDGADVDLWNAMVDAQKQGLVTDIGVSNYSLAQIDALREATGVTPAVNQIEWSPLLFDRAVLDGNRQQGVVLEGYSALRGGTLEHPVIGEIASAHGRTPAQVIIRWHIQHGVVVIPKSVKRERIAANAAVGDFSLTDEEMAKIDALGRS